MKHEIRDKLSLDDVLTLVSGEASQEAGKNLAAAEERFDELAAGQEATQRTVRAEAGKNEDKQESVCPSIPIFTHRLCLSEALSTIQDQTHSLAAYGLNLPFPVLSLQGAPKWGCPFTTRTHARTLDLSSMELPLHLDLWFLVPV